MTRMNGALRLPNPHNHETDFQYAQQPKSISDILGWVAADPDVKALFASDDPSWVPPDVARIRPEGLVMPSSQVGGNGATIPDSAELDITGDLEVQVLIDSADIANGDVQILVNKDNVTPPERSWGLRFTAAGELQCNWFPDGTNPTFRAATQNIGASIGRTTNINDLWLRWRLDVETTPGNWQSNFSWRYDGDASWTDLAPVTGPYADPTVGIHASSADIGVGDYSPMGGTSKPAVATTIKRVIVKDGIDGTTVLDADFRRPRCSSFTASTGQTVTLHSEGLVDAWKANGSTRLDGAHLDTADGLVLPGVINNYASVPDEAELDVTGDLDIRVNAALDDWSNLRVLLSKLASNAGYQFQVQDASGVMRFRWGDGATTHAVDSTAGNGITDGQTSWVRVTLDVDNGAGGYDVNFYKSSDGTSWTQIGATVTGGATTTVAAGAAECAVGAVTGGAVAAIGGFHQAQVYDGIDGTPVLDVDFRRTDTNQFTSYPFGIKTEGGGLVLPGISGHYAAAPDEAAVDITGDIDLRVEIDGHDWDAQVGLICKSAVYEFMAQGATKKLRLLINNSISLLSTAGVSLDSGHLRATLDVDDGGGNCVATFYESVDGATWTQVGAPVSAAALTINTNSNRVEFGSAANGTARLAAATFRRAQVLDGIDGAIVLDADFTDVAPGSDTFLATTGQIITVNPAHTPQTVTVNNTYDLFPTGGVTYTDSDPDYNDRPTVRTGIGNYLETGTWATAMGFPTSIFAVGNFGDTGNHPFFDGVGSRYIVGIALGGGAPWFARFGSVTTSGAALADTSKHLFGLIADAIDEAQVDGVPFLSGALDPTTTGPSGLTLGAWSSTHSGTANNRYTFVIECGVDMRTKPWWGPLLRALIGGYDLDYTY